MSTYNLFDHCIQRRTPTTMGILGIAILSMGHNCASTNRSVSKDGEQSMKTLYNAVAQGNIGKVKEILTILNAQGRDTSNLSNQHKTSIVKALKNRQNEIFKALLHTPWLQPTFKMADHHGQCLLHHLMAYNDNTICFHINEFLTSEKDVQELVTGFEDTKIENLLDHKSNNCLHLLARKNIHWIYHFYGNTEDALKTCTNIYDGILQAIPLPTIVNMMGSQNRDQETPLHISARSGGSGYFNMMWKRLKDAQAESRRDQKDFVQTRC